MQGSLLEILIVGAVSSAIYAMLAVGFTLIFGVARVLNLAHGSFYALGAYGAYVLTSQLKLPLLPAALLAVALVAVFGVVVERVFIRPMRNSQLAVLMITLAVALVVEQALFLTFGSEYRNVPAFIDAQVHASAASTSPARGCWRWASAPSSSARCGCSSSARGWARRSWPSRRTRRRRSTWASRATASSRS